jgi:ABC-type Zn uptake system ZnuABC Zn-binding protein ZnuA
MYKTFIKIFPFFFLVVFFVAACQPSSAPPAAPGTVKVIAVETFLADIAQNVAGDRLQVEALMPVGLDPHSFEPSPQDIARISESQVLIINGAGFEEWLAETLQNAGGDRTIIEASKGLQSRDALISDPHFWLDPLHVIRYVENIRDGLIQIDPSGSDTYTQNAAAYIAQLKDLDAWIAQQVAQIPPEHRLIVTNHESFGYFADRYEFTIIGTIIPSVSSGSSPSAQQLAQLIDTIRQTGVTAIFLETGANSQLAEQVSQETGVTVVTDLISHSITAPGGLAPTYIDMMKYNVETIVSALKK